MANKDFMDPELTEEEKRETILANEDDYLEGLLAAADNAANDTTNDTLDEAKKEAREILADDGKPKEEITIKLPDMPQN